MRELSCSFLLLMAFTASACTDEGDTGDSSTEGDTDTGDGDGDTDTDTGDGDGDGNTDTGAEIDVQDLVTQHLGDMEMTPTLMVEANGDGIDVVHMEHWDNCCFQPIVVTDVADQVISVSYDNTSEECDCVCGWQLSYRLAGLESGTWTVRLSDQLSADATVE